jgi:hypothetical protein
VPGSQVVDANGTAIGNVFVQDLPLREIDGVWYQVDSIVTDGLMINNAISTFLLYPTPDCSGNAYMNAGNVPPLARFVDPTNPGNVPNTPVTVANIAYPKAPFVPMTLKSVGSQSACTSIPVYAQAFPGAGLATITTMPLTIVPPLSIQ